ncbi:MAG: ABC transporter substrate-binding protein [Candidatus Aminicenantales bacterium]
MNCLKTKLCLGLALFITLTSSLAAQTKTVIDALGQPFSLNAPPQRIISLAPNITEILFALDLGLKIVAVTRYCDFPPQALTKEKIGGMIDPNLEKIKALNPDLIIGFRGNPLRTLKRIKSLNLPLFVLEMGNNLESVFEIIKKIGIITYKEQKAAILIQKMRNKYQKIKQNLKLVDHWPKVFFSLHGFGLWTCGRHSFLDTLLREAKGINIAGRINRKWLVFNREQLIHEDPEIIIIISKSPKQYALAKNWITNEKSFQGVRAVVSHRLYYLDENMATRPGPRLIDALEELARLLHPQFFENIKSK